MGVENSIIFISNTSGVQWLKMNLEVPSLKRGTFSTASKIFTYSILGPENFFSEETVIQKLFTFDWNA